jgi:hypothetical protein
VKLARRSTLRPSMNIIPLRTQMATTSLFGNERDKVTFARKQAFIAQLMTHCFNVPDLWRLKKVRASARVHYVRLAALTHHGARRARERADAFKSEADHEHRHFGSLQ